MKLEQGVCLALEARQRAEEDQHARLKAEEKGWFVEESRLKYIEEDLRLKDEDEARLVDEARLKSEQEEQ